MGLPHERIEVKEHATAAMGQVTEWPSPLLCPKGHLAIRFMHEGAFTSPYYECVDCGLLYRIQECTAP